MQQTKASLQENSVLQLEKKYLLLEKINNGSFSDVWKAIDVDELDACDHDYIEEIKEIIKSGDLDASDFVAIKVFNIIPNQKYAELRQNIDLSEFDVLFQFRFVFCIRILILICSCTCFAIVNIGTQKIFHLYTNPNDIKDVHHIQ